MDATAHNRLATLCRRYDRLFGAFHEAGHSLYLVGGCVRDLMMGPLVSAQTPDIDFATSARPAQIKALLQAKGWRTYAVGERYGTIATIHDDQPIEITTFRAHETYARGSRKPEVVFGDTIEADLHRRDLTINAMAAGPGGTLIDPFGGVDALRDKVLEVPGGDPENTLAVLREDPLRILRVARFASRLGFHPSAVVTQAALATHAALACISRERWKMELDKILQGEAVDTALQWLSRTGSLGIVLPWLPRTWHEPSMADHAALLRAAPRDLALRWSLLLLPALYTAPAQGRTPGCNPGSFPCLSEQEHAPLDNLWTPVLADAEASERAERPEIAHRRAALMHDLSNGLKLSREEATTWSRLLEIPLPISMLDNGWDRAAVYRQTVELGPQFERALLLLERLFERSGETADPSASLTLPARRRAWSQLQEAWASLHFEGDPAPVLPKGLGHALHQRFGVERGPALGEAMAAVREAIFRGELRSRPSIEQVLAWWPLHGAEPTQK